MPFTLEGMVWGEANACFHGVCFRPWDVILTCSACFEMASIVMLQSLNFYRTCPMYVTNGVACQWTWNAEMTFFSSYQSIDGLYWKEKCYKPYREKLYGCCSITVSVSPSLFLQQCVNASLTLCEMIRLSREAYQQMSDPTPLDAVLEGKDMIQRLLGNIFASEVPSNVLVVSGISVLLVILREK